MCFDQDHTEILTSNHKLMVIRPDRVTRSMPATLLIVLIIVFSAMTDCIAADLAPHRNGMTQEGAVEVKSTDRSAAPSVPSSPGQGVEKNRTKPPEEPVREKGNAARGIGKQTAPPPLDLPSLEKRLRETRAIGVFTKITLKNQVDDLVDQFREFHRGRGKTTLAELRQRYDLLLLKLLSLLQDNDPTLARTIAVSRESIWTILTDPDKFVTL